jgi:hypothetical protein
MLLSSFLTLASIAVLHQTPAAKIDTPSFLRVGAAFHAFEHLGAFDHQAPTAAACGVTVIYASGLGGDGYSGLPPAAEWARRRAAEAKYVRDARAAGIKVALGYLCATSLVGLDSFDRNFPLELRKRLRTPPAEWRQQDRQGRVLPSWYGGQYQPACMNNPDWRTYQHYMVEQQLATGHDGIFFDNPTVHDKGCYCPHCMEHFLAYLKSRALPAKGESTELLRQTADARPDDFQRFRCTIARDFLADMRVHARRINPRALITANNSLNSPKALFAQCRSYAYNIRELARAEDFVVIEDMGTQPRVLPSGQVIEYGPTYKQVQALSQGKPVVAVTIAKADYHTPANLVRLAMAEAVANRASYLAWTTWPAAERPALIAATKRQADFLRVNQALLNDTRPRKDALLFLPFRRWVQTPTCAASALAAQLVSRNVQFEVIDDEHLTLPVLQETKLLVVESSKILEPAEKHLLDAYRAAGGQVIAADEPSWLATLDATIGTPSVKLEKAPATVRAYVHDQPGQTIVHLLQLDVRRLSSFRDEVHPASAFVVQVKVPYKHVQSVRLLSSDAGTTTGNVAFASKESTPTIVSFAVGRLEVSALVVIEGN